MFLSEDMCKIIFSDYGIPVPEGRVARSLASLIKNLKQLGRPAVLKALVNSGGRGKMGGILFADNLDDATILGKQLFSLNLANQAVQSVLVEERLFPKEELYLAVTIDPYESKPVILFSLAGGINVEEVECKLEKLYFDPLKPLKISDLRRFAGDCAVPVNFRSQIASLMEKILRIFFDYDALTVEINPLVITDDNDIIAADAKIIIDDSALYRHKTVGLPEAQSPLHSLELQAQKTGLSLVIIDEGGEIGLLCGGAGLGMATMDTVVHYGGKIANFLDTGGGLTEDKMATALQIVLSIPKVKGVLINVFGGINNCLYMARGIAKTINDENYNEANLPIVVKMQGHFQDEGWDLLEKLEPVTLIKEGCIDDAVEAVIKLVSKRR